MEHAASNEAHCDRLDEAAADVADRLGPAVAVCHLPFRSFGSVRRTSGLIACVRTYEDAGLVRDMLSVAGDGRILVVDGRGSCRAALIGNRLARMGLSNGWRGVVINGAIRDADLLSTLPFAVLAVGTTPQRGSLAGEGERDVALAFGGIDLRPGQRLWLDADGVLVSVQ